MDRRFVRANTQISGRPFPFSPLSFFPVCTYFGVWAQRDALSICTSFFIWWITKGQLFFGLMTRQAFAKIFFCFLLLFLSEPLASTRYWKDLHMIFMLFLYYFLLQRINLLFLTWSNILSRSIHLHSSMLSHDFQSQASLLWSGQTGAFLSFCTITSIYIIFF